jgi:hypothetical protein
LQQTNRSDDESGIESFAATELFLIETSMAAELGTFEIVFKE